MNHLVHRVVDDSLDRGFRERHYVVLGPKGAVEYREMLPQHMPLGIEWHSPKPHTPGDEPVKCRWLETGCHEHGSSCKADQLRRRYVDSGDEADIWHALEAYYRDAFEGSRS